MITSEADREAAREAGISLHLFDPKPIIKIESPPPEISNLKADSGWQVESEWKGDSGWADDDWDMTPQDSSIYQEKSPEEPPKKSSICQKKSHEDPQPIRPETPHHSDENDKAPEPSPKLSQVKDEFKHVVIKKEFIIENGSQSQSKKYNLRPKSTIRSMTHRSKKVKYQANLPKWIPKTAENCFRDSILTEVNIHSYHPQIQYDEYADKVINITGISKKSQLESFIYSSRKFVAICWLTTLRIFEYILDKNLYLEVKRIPNRYIALSPQLLTSVHCDSNLNFYLARLWGSQDKDADPEKPYIEVRDLFGNLVFGKPFYYDNVVKEIYSDNLFIYVRLGSNVVYLHRKNFFKLIYFRIDFNEEGIATHIESPIISSWVATSSFDSYTKLFILSATSKQLFVTRYDIFNHRFINSYNFTECPEFTIVSIDKYKRDFIIHRNTTSAKSNPDDEYLSKVDIGSISNENHSFEPHINLSFQYFILQVRVHKDCIYLFGYRENRDGARSFEIGCLSIKDLNPKPRWTTYLNGVDIDTQILVHSDNISIIKSNQQISCISTASRDRHECRCCKLSFLKKEDKLVHEEHLPKSMFGFKFGLNKIQVPPKKIPRRMIENGELNQIKVGSQASDD